MTDGSKKPIEPVRVRFAPSPTGFLHIGSARTVLFNWLFAKQNKGKFILRIEDTDIERSNPEFEKDIIAGIKWLGLDWDEGPIPPESGEFTISNFQFSNKYIGEYGPYRQSERLDIYEKYLRQLIDENKAYYCFCSKEQLELDRQAMLAQGLAPKYSGRCRHLSKEEAENRLKNGEPAVIRFRVPETEIEFNDLIRGKIKVNTTLIGDIVIARNFRSPLYNFSAAVDDFEMKITHIIRGEDHISNTPKQILIQKALGFNEPKYAHLPLILAPDRSKLSKRYLETSLNDYRKQGYLPEAIVNFLALLGWHPKDDKEILSLEELINEFDLKRVQKAGAVFNIEKLEWLNSQYIKKTNAESLAEKIKDFIPIEWSKDENRTLLVKAIEIEKERMQKLTDFKELADFFFVLPDYDARLLIWPRLTPLKPFEENEELKINKNKTLANLKLLLQEINNFFKADFNKASLEKLIMPLTEVWGRGELLWPLRVALSGKEASPGPFELMEVLGKEETLRRLNIAIEKLNN
jgi:glutamyl-tRNA synthetase